MNYWVTIPCFQKDKNNPIPVHARYTKGKCEETLGEIFVEHPELREKTTIASKVNPFPGFDESLGEVRVWAYGFRTHM